jgi:hypothetical protein
LGGLLSFGFCCCCWCDRRQHTLFFSQWTIKQSTDPFDFLAPVSSQSSFRVPFVQKGGMMDWLGEGTREKREERIKAKVDKQGRRKKKKWTKQQLETSGWRIWW